MNINFLQKLDFKTNDDLKKISKEYSNKEFELIKVSVIDDSDDNTMQLRIEPKSNENIEESFERALCFIAGISLHLSSEMVFSINNFKLEFLLSRAFVQQTRLAIASKRLNFKNSYPYEYPVEPIRVLNRTTISPDTYSHFFRQSKPYSHFYISKKGTIVSVIYNLRLFYRILCNELSKYQITRKYSNTSNSILEHFFNVGILPLENFNQSHAVQNSMLVNFVQGRLKFKSLTFNTNIFEFKFKYGASKKMASFKLPVVDNSVHIHFIQPEPLFALALYDGFLNGTYFLQELITLADSHDLKIIFYFMDKDIAQLAKNCTRLEHLKHLNTDLITFAPMVN